MNSKLILFIKVIINIIIVALFIAAICMIIKLDKQNAKLNQTNYELTISIDKQKNTIDRLTQNNKGLSSEIAQLTGANNKLRDNNNFLEAQIQELLTQVEELENRIITPSYDDFKSYLPYDAITNQLSKQWQLQQQATTNEDGIRCIDGIPLVAVGTGWGLSVGDIALVTCDNGNSFKVMIGDIKADIHTDAANKTTIASGCRCEFIVDLNKLIPQVKSMGNVAILAKYSGYVVNIEKIV